MHKLFGVLFFLTGIFALVGGLYTWGIGSIFSQTDLHLVLIPWADIIVTGPLSLICGYGLYKNLGWGRVIGLSVSGMYIFGSVLVFIVLIWNHNYSILFLVPSISGFLIGLSFLVSHLLTQKKIEFQ